MWWPCLNRLRAAISGVRAWEPAGRTGEPAWLARHEAGMEAATDGGHRLVFIGDSITRGFEDEGAEVWSRYYEPRRSLNLGISGDRTENVLWRLENGGLENVRPALFVLMIGTNNTGLRLDRPGDTARGIGTIVSLLRGRCPEAVVLLQAILPRGLRPDDRLRRINAEVNRLIRPLADGDAVRWLDAGDRFVREDGSLDESLLPDGLHPGPEGYRVWAEAMEPAIAGLLD